MSGTKKTTNDSISKKVKIEELPLDKLYESEDNPQTMTPGEFNRLVTSIQEDGFDEPIIVTPNEGRDTYQIISGHHRFKACRLLEYKTMPCIVKTYSSADQRRIKMIKANVIRGKLDAKKFTAIVNKLLEKHDQEELEFLLGFSDRKAFERLYKEIRSGLPEEIRDKLDETKQEIRTIEDLALVLNRLFAEYGETVDQHFMVFSYGGRKHLWVETDKELWDLINKMTDDLKESKEDIVDYLKTKLG